VRTGSLASAPCCSRLPERRELGAAGDTRSEQFLFEMASPPSYADRHLSMGFVYKCGSRIGAWFTLREFEPRAAADDVRRRRGARARALPEACAHGTPPTGGKLDQTISSTTSTTSSPTCRPG